MKWVNIESLIIDSSVIRTLNEILKKEAELDFDHIPPIKIDSNGRIIDGVKRYLVLIKNNYTQVPVVQENMGKKIYLSLNVNTETDYPLAA